MILFLALHFNVFTQPFNTMITLAFVILVVLSMVPAYSAIPQDSAYSLRKCKRRRADTNKEIKEALRHEHFPLCLGLSK